MGESSGVIKQNTMDNMFLSVLIAVLSLCLTIVLTAKAKWSQSGKKKLPPGSMGWPVVGETLEFVAAGRRGAPEEFFTERMKKHSAEMFKTSIAAQRVVVPCGAAGNKFVFTNEHKLVRPWWPLSAQKILLRSSVQSSTSEELAKARKMLLRFLKPEALQKYVGVMDSIARQQLQTSWDSKDRVVVYPLVKTYTFVVACRLFLSVEDPQHIAAFAHPFYELVAGLMSVPVNFPGTAFYRAIKAAEFLRKEIGKIIDQRKVDLWEERVAATQDILSHMLTTRDEDGELMKEMDVADIIIGLLFAGHDTASAALAFTMKYMAQHPQVYNQVLQEQIEIASRKPPEELLKWDDLQKMKYTWNVASEAMRLAPPAPGSFREAIKDFNYAGFSVPKGWKLYWSSNSTHRNPEYFPDPEKFDPSRFEGKGPIAYSYVPFGGGPRMCPGKEYARLEILVFMYNVVRKFKWEKVIEDEKVVVEPMPRPANGFPVRLYPH